MLVFVFLLIVLISENLIAGNSLSTMLKIELEEKRPSTMVGKRPIGSIVNCYVFLGSSLTRSYLE